MSGLSDYVETAVLNHIFRGIAIPFAPPASVYIALFLSDPTDSGLGGVEVSGGSYARALVSTSGQWSPPSVGPAVSTTTNINTIAFATATADWGNVTHVAVFDALVAGNMFYHGPLPAPQFVANGQQWNFNPNSFVLQLG